jgi:hypothetical protein
VLCTPALPASSHFHSDAPRNQGASVTSEPSGQLKAPETARTQPTQPDMISIRHRNHSLLPRQGWGLSTRPAALAPWDLCRLQTRHGAMPLRWIRATQTHGAIVGLSGCSLEGGTMRDRTCRKHWNWSHAQASHQVPPSTTTQRPAKLHRVHASQSVCSLSSYKIFNGNAACERRPHFQGVHPILEDAFARRLPHVRQFQ